jgi:hypothetical protein
VEVARNVRVGHVVQAELSALCQFVLLEERDAMPVLFVLEVARRSGHGGRDCGDDVCVSSESCAKVT